MFTDGAGVIKHKVGFLENIRHLIAHLLKHTLESFAVGNVSLTAIGMNKSFCAFAVFLPDKAFDKGGKLLLPLKLVGGNADFKFIRINRQSRIPPLYI